MDDAWIPLNLPWRVVKKQAIVTLHCMNKQEYAGHLCSDPKVRENFTSCCQLHRFDARLLKSLRPNKLYWPIARWWRCPQDP